MSQSRIEAFLQSEQFILERPSRPIESLFEGPQNFAAILTQEIERIKEKAAQEGYKKAITDISNIAKEKVEKYIFNVSFIVGIVHHFANVEIKKEIKIIDSRTRFCFDSEWIDITFIVDADPDSEIVFSNLLSRIQFAILQKLNIIIELFYVNERSRKIDYAALKNDYPFVVKPAVIKT